MNKKLIKKIIKLAGGPTKLGLLCGVSRQAVWIWENTTENIPRVHHIKVEKICAEKNHPEIDRYSLDPDFWNEAMPQKQ